MMDKSLASSQPQVCGICMKCSPYSLSYYFINTILISLLLAKTPLSFVSVTMSTGFQAGRENTCMFRWAPPKKV